jgi:hypothetical protein
MAYFIFCEAEIGGGSGKEKAEQTINGGVSQTREAKSARCGHRESAVGEVAPADGAKDLIGFED